MLFTKFIVAPKYYEDVQARFLERLNYIPPQKPELLSRKSLTKWLADTRPRGAISGYVFPILFPLDILFLLSLGLLLRFGSVAITGQTAFLANVPPGIWWFLPVLYIVADLSEDSLVAGIFKAVIPLTDSSYLLLHKLTAIKLAAVSVAIGKVGFLVALLALMHFFPAQR
jgi:hypothetical protein